MAKDRVARLWDLAAAGLMSDVFLRLSLPAITAGRLMAGARAAAHKGCPIPASPRQFRLTFLYSSVHFRS
jgi:hypothetical protein